MKKVSVIVPVYNTEQYLRKCLDSLVNQTLDDIEIMVIDDGSTDGSTDIIKEYETTYPLKIRAFYKENGGQASARNLGIKKSTGEYIGFLDSDDFVRLDMFEKLYHQAKIDNYDYVGCGYTDLTYIDGREVVLQEYVRNNICKNNREMYFDAIVSPFINFYKGDIIRNNEIYFPEGFIYEDTAFWVNAVPYLEKITYVEESLAYRLRRDNSTTTIFQTKKVEQIFSVIDSILEYYHSHDLYNDYKNEVEYFCTRILLCSSMKRVSCISSAKDRRYLVKKTMSYIHDKFPHYKKNTCYRKRKIDIFMKYSNLAFMQMIVWLMHVKGVTI